MDFQCLQANLYGQKVRVNGTQYDVSADGVVAGVSDADAKKLMAMPLAWKKVVARKAVEMPLPAPEEAEVAALAATLESEGIEWPDPEESMDLDYLQKMADAYEVKYAAKTSKKTLVQAIKKAMYE